MNSLFLRLAAVLLGLFTAVGIAILLIARLVTDLYYQEVTQKLNADIAMYIVETKTLLTGGEVQEDALQSLAMQVMIVNPSVEVYLLDADGRIIGHAAPEDRVLRERVDLEPVRSFLSPDRTLPILGDDPKSGEKQKIFSAAPVSEGDRTIGYLYAVLGGEQYEAVSAIFRASYIRRLGALAIVAIIGFAFVSGVLVSFLLTRRLKRLRDDVDAFEPDGFRNPQTAPAMGRGDEIDRLSAAFTAMSARIAEQVHDLERTDELRRELVANVSHDLRTPLASMQGYIETLLLKGDRLSDEDKRQYLEIARSHGQQLSSLVAELFELAKLDSGSVAPHREAFSIAELAQDVTQKFRLQADEQQVRLEPELCAGLPFVDADIAMIERVLENLIDNALDHTPSGGSVRVHLSNGSGRVQVRVRDTGTGIAANDLPHVFDRFYRGETANQDGQRNGLGLAIVKRILELHGSDVDVTSMPGKGTEFRFALESAPGQRPPGTDASAA